MLSFANRGRVDPTAQLDALWEAPIGIAFLNRDLRFVRVNDALARMDGLPMEAHIGRTLAEVLPHAPSTVHQTLTRVLESGAPAWNVQVSTGRPGDPRHWLAHFSPIREGDHITGIYALVVESTAQRRAEQAEEARRRSDELSRLLAANYAGGAVFLFDPGLRYTLVGGPALEALGLSKERLEGRTLQESLPPELATHHGPSCRAALLGTTTQLDFSFGGRIYRADFVPVRDERGQLVGGMCITQDRTVLARTEQALRDSESQFRLIAEMLPQLVWIARADGFHIYYNQRWFEYTGLSPEASSGEGWSSVLHPEDLPRTIKRWQHALATGQRLEADMRLRRADGVYRWFLVRGAPSLDASGKPLKWFGTCTDIDDERRAQEERLQLLEREQAARAEAEEASRLKDEFLATVSHELRTPLTAIMGWVRLLRMGHLSAEKHERALETLERNAKAQAQLIEDLLDVSRIITGKLRLEVGPVDVPAVIRAALEAVRPAAEAKGITLQPMLDPGAGPLLGDTARLQQVIWNLLSNAVKFTPAAGRVQVRLARHGASVEIAVADNGQGIPPDFLPHVFERFRQAQGGTTQRGRGGLGLGLAIVRHLVEMHGGSVQARSEGEGKGATFTVRLPLAIARELSPAESLADPLRFSEGSGLECPPHLHGVKVLMVEGEPDARELIRTILEGCQAQVSTADSLAEALEAIQATPPDVIVSSLSTPGQDGYALIRRLRALPPEQGGTLPAVAILPCARTEERTRALRAGFDMQVARPVDPTELSLIVANLASRNRRQH